MSASDIDLGADPYDPAAFAQIWAPRVRGEESGADWGLMVNIDRAGGLWPNDLLRLTFTPTNEVRALVEVGVAALQPTLVEGVVFDPDWLEKVVPNVPAPEPEIVTLYAR
ncbi:hypothetical protein AXK58_24260 [Tsukamurella tyrosinosolvens]|nr:hypothetical protein AXK58_24260 [Tsukamurella tyrosinosolvens]